MQQRIRSIMRLNPNRITPDTPHSGGKAWTWPGHLFGSRISFPLTPALSLRAEHSPQLDESRGRIPTGFRLKAQGCEQRATLGKGTRARSTPTGLRRLRGERRPQPRWGWHLPTQFTQGSSLLATLGWRTQSLWDWGGSRRLVGNAQPLGRGRLVYPVLRQNRNSPASPQRG
jgi:hypothetical protein